MCHNFSGGSSPVSSGSSTLRSVVGTTFSVMVTEDNVLCLLAPRLF